MDADVSTPLVVVGSLVVGLVLFFAAATGFLRLGCTAASRIGVYAGKYEPFAPPGVRTSLGIVLAAVIVLSLAGSATEPLIRWLAAYVDERPLRATASALEWIFYAMLVAAGIGAAQKIERRMALLAATLHTSLLLGAGLALNVLIRTIVR